MSESEKIYSFWWYLWAALHPTMLKARGFKLQRSSCLCITKAEQLIIEELLSLLLSRPSKTL